MGLSQSVPPPCCLSFPVPRSFQLFLGTLPTYRLHIHSCPRICFRGPWPNKWLYLNCGIMHNFHHCLSVLSNCSLKHTHVLRNRRKSVPKMFMERDIYGWRSGSQIFFFFATPPAPDPGMGRIRSESRRTRVVGEGSVSQSAGV